MYNGPIVDVYNEYCAVGLGVYVSLDLLSRRKIGIIGMDDSTSTGTEKYLCEAR